tara:strand:+ start:1696 stop:5430 length:3735 start_codon:yes stop_codon:yes gene_type:complete
MRWIWRILAATSLVIVLALATVTGMLGTVSGTEWLLTRATNLLNTESRQFSYDRSQGTFLRGLNLQGVRWIDDSMDVRAAQLHSRWNPMTLLEGTFNLESLRLTGLQLTLAESDAPAEPAAPLVLDDILDTFLPLPIAIDIYNARFDGIRIQSGDISVAINLLAFSAHLQGRQLSIDSLALDSPPAHLEAAVNLTLEQPYPVEATAQWQYDEVLLENTQPPSGELTLTGNLNRLQLEHSLRGIASVLSEGEVTLELARFLNAQAEAIDPRVDLEHTLEPMQVPGMESYDIRALRLRTQGSPDDLGLFAAAQINAEISADVALEADMNVRAYLRGSTLDIDELALRSTNDGRLLIAGEVDWSQGVQVTLDYSITDPTPTSYIASIPESIRLRELASQGSLSLSQAENESLQLQFMMAELSANLNDFDLNGSGGLRFDGDEWHVQDLAIATGENSLRLDASVEPEQSIRATATIDAPSLAAIYPDLDGRLQVDAQVSGTVSEPVIDLDASASNVRYGEYLIPELTITGQNRGGMNEIEMQTGNIRVPVGESVETVESLQLRLRGAPDAHSLLLLVQSSLGSARINADGGTTSNGWQGRLLNSEVSSEFGTWAQQQSTSIIARSERLSMAETCWAMRDTRLCLDGELSGGEQLDANARLENYPLSALNLPATERSLQQLGGIELHDGSEAEPYRLPFSLPPDLALAGRVNVSAQVAGLISSIDQLDIQAEIDATGGSLYFIGQAVPEELEGADAAASLAEPEISQFRWPELTGSASLQNGDWQLDSLLRFTQEDPESSAVIQGTATANVGLAADRSLSGNLQLNFDDIAWAAALAPQISDVSGQLTGRMNLQGSMEAPVLVGDLNLTDASVAVPILGIQVAAIDATLSSRDNSLVELNGYAESGAGSLNFGGQLSNPFDERREFSLQVAGSNFTVADLPDIQAAISPDIRLQGNIEGIELSGQLFIPSVDARINTLPESAVDVSSDTIIINQPASGEPVRNAAIADTGLLGNTPVSGEITITLGDDVRISGFGLNAQVSGELDITQRPNATPLTYGELEVVQGSFETYGRVLTIEQGKLLFMGSYDNPAIDIRAVRQVENMRVGVQMNGTIQNIRSDLFSTPSLSDGDILAVMITGRPMSEIGTEQDGNALVGAATSLGINQTQGIVTQIQDQLGLDTLSIDSRGDVSDSSLMLGKYITPRIFVRYAVGLFETESSLAVEYTVNDRVRLEATSGQSQSIDLTYTVEQ